MKLTKEQAQAVEDEMRRLESDPSADKHALRLFMQEPMPCGHPAGNLLTSDSPPPFGCLICGPILSLAWECTHQKNWPCNFRDPRLCAHDRMLSAGDPTFCDCRCHFEAHLEDASAIVAAWPEWKRNLVFHNQQRPQ